MRFSSLLIVVIIAVCFSLSVDADGPADINEPAFNDTITPLSVDADGPCFHPADINEPAFNDTIAPASRRKEPIICIPKKDPPIHTPYGDFDGCSLVDDRDRRGPLNGPNCIPKDPPVVTAWGAFDGCGTCAGCTPGNDITGIYVNQEE